MSRVRTGAGGRPTAGSIRLEAVSRSFIVDHAQVRSLKDFVLRRGRGKSTQFWAVRDLDLDVPPGQSIGIVGRNGSGKSTALKLIAGILPPSTGRVTTSGSVASMLELGSGFHPDFTGRENVFLNGALFGFPEREMVRRFDEIVAFAEVEDFIDAPVRTYSSGMQVRLAFAVASHVRADIMLLDEVFAVGDEAFQRKCLTKMFDFRRQGGTIVFVSHDPNAISRLCDRAILMDHGRQVEDGVPRDVLLTYHQLLSGQSSRTGTPASREESLDEAGTWGTKEVTVSDCRLLRRSGVASPTFLAGDSITVEFDYVVHTPVDELNFGIAIHSIEGVRCFETTTQREGLGGLRGDRDGTVRVRIPHLPLQDGQFTVSLSIADPTEVSLYHVLEHYREFAVVPRGHEVGIVLMGGQWEVESAGGVVSVAFGRSFDWLPTSEGDRSAANPSS